MYKTTKITPLLRELIKAQKEYEKRIAQVSQNLFYVAKNVPMTERAIYEQLGISRATWSSYKKKGLPYEKMLQLIDIFKGLKYDNQPVIV